MYKVQDYGLLLRNGPKFPAARLAAFSEIHHSAFGEHYWDTRSLSELLELPTTIVCWTEDQQQFGFAIWQVSAPDAELLTIAVAKHCQGKGIGEEILRHSLKKLNELQVTNALLEVRESNKTGIKLYKKVGFNAISARNDYYRIGDSRESAIIMSKSIHATLDDVG